MRSVLPSESSAMTPVIFPSSITSRLAGVDVKISTPAFSTA